jgi:hypothetical protein
MPFSFSFPDWIFPPSIEIVNSPIPSIRVQCLARPMSTKPDPVYQTGAMTSLTRTRRIEFPGAGCHFASRRNERKKIFLMTAIMRYF